MQPRYLAHALRALGPTSLAVALTFWTSASSGAEHDPAQVLARADALRLWTKTAWLRLLHYRPDTFGGVSSEVDDAAFFLSPDGRDDPRAEIRATLAAFYQPVSGTLDSHARCRFPARFQWLDERLDLSTELPRVRCRKLEHFETRLTPDSVALVYAANSVDSPVSAFGHTFLVFRRAGQPRDAGHVIEYTAETDTENPFLYAFKGIFGLFEGHLRYSELGDKLKYYLEDQARDLWEYELALTPGERRQLTRHLWELSRSRLDYYYVSENCSYGLLSLLEAGVPRLELIGKTKYVVPPVDTVKALFGTPGLVQSVRHRAARGVSEAVLRTPPHRGHASMRILLGTGFSSHHDDGFATLGYRIALHDLADPPPGQPALSQIQFMDARVR